MTPKEIRRVVHLNVDRYKESMDSLNLLMNSESEESNKWIYKHALEELKAAMLNDVSLRIKRITWAQTKEEFSKQI